MPGLAVPHPPAGDDHRLPGCLEQVGEPIKLALAGDSTLDVVHPLLEELDGVVVRLALYVLGQGDGDRSGLGHIGEGAHRIEHGAHQLLRPVDPVPIAGDGAEGVIGGVGVVVGNLDLLQHRVGLAAGKDIPWQKQDRNVVRRCRTCTGDHVQGPGADGTGHRHDLAPIVFLGEGSGGVYRPLLILRLVEGQLVPAVSEGLSDAHDTAVAEDAEDPLYEF